MSWTEDRVSRLYRVMNSNSRNRAGIANAICNPPLFEVKQHRRLWRQFSGEQQCERWAETAQQYQAPCSESGQAVSSLAGQ